METTHFLDPETSSGWTGWIQGGRVEVQGRRHAFSEKAFSHSEFYKGNQNFCHSELCFRILKILSDPVSVAKRSVFRNLFISESI